MATVRLFSRNRDEADYLSGYESNERLSHARKLKGVLVTEICVELSLMAGLALISYYVVDAWGNAQITTGEFVYIIWMVTGITYFTWHLGTTMPQFFSEVGVCKQALSIITPPHDIVDVENAKELKVDKGEIVFDDVQFHYVPGKDIFRDKSLTIKPGEKIGLVGFSGSGKTTFVNLVLRLYDVEGGEICIDGQNIAKVTQDSLREHIAVIPQDTTLFHRSLMDNIRFGKMDATDDEVIVAAKKAHCHAFIEELPEGYETLVGERGVKLSGGQRQRIAIARAFLKQAPIIILDEATSALDSETEALIQQSLHELLKGKTTIVIAHRLSTLSMVDRILVFDAGEIIEEGSHDTLLKIDGHYAKLWHMQAGGFLPEL